MLTFHLLFVFAGKELKVAEIAQFKLENDLRKEHESLSAVETMLGNYKEEVFTLNEALKIAALDIAEIAQGEDEEDAYVLNDTLNTLQETLNAQENKGHHVHSHGDTSGPNPANIGSNVEQVHHHIRSDAQIQHVSNANNVNSGAAFMINDDGTFVQS